MTLDEFVKNLPEKKRELYKRVYNTNSLNMTNQEVADKVGIKLTMVEQIRHDLIAAGLIKKKRPSYRKDAGLPPSRQKKKALKPQSKHSSTKGLTGDKTRHTFIIDKSNLENINLLSHYDHKGKSEFLNDLLSDYFFARENDIYKAKSHRDRSRKIRLKIKEN